jgi:hypothetical protein
MNRHMFYVITCEGKVKEILFFVRVCIKKIKSSNFNSGLLTLHWFFNSGTKRIIMSINSTHKPTPSTSESTAQALAKEHRKQFYTCSDCMG